MPKEEEDVAQPDEQAARRAAVDIAAGADKQDPDKDVVELSNGIRLRVRTVPPLILRQPVQHLPEPQPPTVHLDKQNVDEPNPGDPEYQRAHAEWEATTGFATVDLMLLLGTTEPTESGEPRPLIEHLPEGIFPPDSDAWVKWLESAKVKVDVSTPQDRYLSWLRSYAVASTKDLDRLSTAIADRTGVKEVDVQTATSSFPSDEARRTNPELASKPNRTDRRALQQRASRSRAGNRGKGRS